MKEQKELKEQKRIAAIISVPNESTESSRTVSVPEANLYEIIGRKEAAIVSLIAEVKRLKNDVQSLNMLIQKQIDTKREYTCGSESEND